MKRNDKFVLRNIYGKKVLVPVKANEVGDDPILMNDVGAEIWCESDNAENPFELVNNILKKYNLSSDSVERQAIEDFVENLLDIKLIYN
jgi:hypothetical protein